MPMLTTAAGTIRPSQALIIGAGVAGLQAIATARRLGAVVEAYDVRSATREQVKSLGAKFVETGVSADGAGGYARELTPEEKAKQQEALDARIAAADAVISTASVPGRKAPVIISKAAVERMRAGSVIVDIAAEQGGNCELTKAGETVVHNGREDHRPGESRRQPRLQRERDVRAQSAQFPQAGDRQVRRSEDRLDATKYSPAPCSRTTAPSNTKPPAKRWRVKTDDRNRCSLHLHARGLHRLRDHRQGAGDPAHAAHVGLELRARHRAGRRHGGARRRGHAAREDHRLRRRAAGRRQRGRRLRGDRTHARDVQVFRRAARSPEAVTDGRRDANAGLLLAAAADRHQLLPHGRAVHPGPEAHELAGDGAQRHRLGRRRHGGRHAGLVPLSGDDQLRADHRRHRRRLADRVVERQDASR